MKRIAAIILILLLGTAALRAQVYKIMIDTRGNFDVAVRTAPGEYITLDQKGNTVDIEMSGEVEYAFGQIIRVGNVVLDYGFDDQMTQVGDFKVLYDLNFNKIRRIGDMEFFYNASGRLLGVGRATISYNQHSLIDAIGRNYYRYGLNNIISSGPRFFTLDGIRWVIKGGAK